MSVLKIKEWLLRRNSAQFDVLQTHLSIPILVRRISDKEDFFRGGKYEYGEFPCIIDSFSTDLVHVKIMLIPIHGLKITIENGLTKTVPSTKFPPVSEMTVEINNIKQSKIGTSFLSLSDLNKQNL